MRTSAYVRPFAPTSGSAPRSSPCGWQRRRHMANDTHAARKQRQLHAPSPCLGHQHMAQCGCTIVALTSQSSRAVSNRKQA